jgi:hypothetical protein
VAGGDNVLVGGSGDAMRDVAGGVMGVAAVVHALMSGVRMSSVRIRAEGSRLRIQLFIFL